MEARSSRSSANRAVAALQAASGAATSASLLLSSSLPRRVTAPVTRYNSFEALREAQQKVDENAELREELRRKLLQPAPRNEVAALGNEVTMRILEFLNPLSADADEFGGTCRSVRESLLHAINVEGVVMVPKMVSPVAIASEAGQRALISFFLALGGGVRRLVIRNADEAAAQDARGEASLPNASPLRLPAPWALQLVSHMPYLVELDLRHVQWVESHASQVLPHLFSDLHIVISGTLRTLKVDADLMQYWKPGWWRRHVNLRTLTVGSRYSFAQSSDDSAPPSTQLELPPDYQTLMREEGRHWRLELWCPLKPNAAQQILLPAAGVFFPCVEELLVNVRYNEHICEETEHGAVASGIAGTLTAAGSLEAASAPEAATDAKVGARGRKLPSAVDMQDAGATYPRLGTLTIVDIGDRPEGAAEIYQVMTLLSPELRRFNVCDTVVIGAAPAAAEGCKGAQVKRGGGAAKNVS
ncbi:hypothetical protein ABL78_4383 [Leptomonas seymouri]|uniref:Sigma-54 factor interaction domain-containing protein n=1 Tax=Leptomonas seymouri TaxID=5684 RepID=A0A0N1I4Z3_LEPSE|nr:hypothetical protein ABL78_4383 [Leptomonas seymouri]|eukprot:KPI86560.1 hypothetical protein ABL78_4383 [Leptomonas seymouri]